MGGWSGGGEDKQNKQTNENKQKNAQKTKTQMQTQKTPQTQNHHYLPKTNKKNPAYDGETWGNYTKLFYIIESLPITFSKENGIEMYSVFFRS